MRPPTRPNHTRISANMEFDRVRKFQHKLDKPLAQSEAEALLVYLKSLSAGD